MLLTEIGLFTSLGTIMWRLNNYGMSENMLNTLHSSNKLWISDDIGWSFRFPQSSVFPGLDSTR